MEENKTRSEAYYLDGDHNIVDSGKATKVGINEFDENGVMIREPGVLLIESPEKKNRKNAESAND